MGEDLSGVDLSTVDDAHLSRWAYGRAALPADALRAREAALELARRAQRAAEQTAGPAPAGASTRDRLTPTQPFAVEPRDAEPFDAEPLDAEPLGDEPLDDDDELETGMSFRDRVAIGAGVAALLIGAVIASQALLAPRTSTATSLAVFERAETAAERSLIGQFERAGERVSLGPRELGTAGFGTIVAYRSLVSSSGVQEPTVDLVCVAAAEYNERTQTTLLTNPTCVNRQTFEQRGIRTTLYGVGGQYDVAWGPDGEAVVDVLMSESQRLAMEPGFEAVFLDLPSNDRAEQYVAEQVLVEQTGLSITQLRQITVVQSMLVPDPVTTPTPPPDNEWTAAYVGDALDGTGEVACLAVIDDGVQLESSCRPVDEMQTRAITLEFERNEKTIVMTWSSFGEISALVTS